MRFLPVLILCVAATQIGFAQSTARGRVLDFESRQPIPGLRVCVKSGSPCVVTDESGRFALPIPDGADSLLFSGMGYSHADAAYPGSEITYGISQQPFSLAAATVQGLLHESSNASSPGSFGVIKRELLEAGDQLSLMHAMNTVPGVTFDSRGYGGSQRIQIRGSFLRAPFAVRNVRMYLNGIPISSPDGTSPLELIDAADIRSVEVVKGPAGSAWGSGTGGVLLFRAKEAAPGARTLSHSQLYGDFGIRRYHSEAGYGGPRWSVRASHVYQENDGYRRQEFNRKQQFSLTAAYRPSERWSLFHYSTWYTGHWALPGGLTASQALADPTRAVAFSENANAGVYRTRFFTGTGATLRTDDFSTLTFSVNIYSTDKFNPYGTSAMFSGFKDEGAGGAGTRAVYARKIQAPGRWLLHAQAGIEGQAESFDLDEYANEGGLPGDFLFSYETSYLSGMAFTAWDATWNNRLRLHAGLSSENSVHAVRGISSEMLVSDTIADLGAHWLPRGGAALRLDSLIWLNASVSVGNSHPTIFEQIDPAVMYSESGALKNRIAPERGINYEAGIKGTAGKTAIDFEATAYMLKLDRLILPFQDSIPSPSDSGTLLEYTRYRNGGSTAQRGIEATVSKTVRWPASRPVSSLTVQFAFTRVNYRFGASEENISIPQGNRIPGLSLNSLNTFVRLSSRRERIILSIQHTWNDRLPLNNDNTAWLDPWHLLNVRADATVWQSGRTGIALRIFGGINNALDASYTSFPNLNDARGRFFNPAPGRNFFGGIRFQVGR
jgi:iron complex outermembrane recepter protein